MTHHPHLHCLVPGGGIAPDGQSWVPCRSGFFLSVTVLSQMFRGLFLHYLEQAFDAGQLRFFSEHRDLHEPAAFRRYLAPSRDARWVVYAKRPFAGPAQVLAYVGRYIHWVWDQVAGPASCRKRQHYHRCRGGEAISLGHQGRPGLTRTAGPQGLTPIT